MKKIVLISSLLTLWLASSSAMEVEYYDELSVSPSHEANKPNNKRKRKAKKHKRGNKKTKTVDLMVSDDGQMGNFILWSHVPAEIRMHILHLLLDDLSVDQVLKNIKTLTLVNTDFYEIARAELLHSAIKRFVERGSGLEKCGEFFKYACRIGSHESVTLLLDGAVPIASQIALKGLLKAAYYKHTEVVNLLLGSSLLQTNGSFASSRLLSAIISNKKPAVIARLIEQGANVNATEANGFTPLLFAVNTGNIEIVKLLLDNGADLDAQNNEGKNALSMAIAHNDLQMVELLLVKGANVHTIDGNGHTALYCGSLMGNERMMSLLKTYSKHRRPSKR